MVTPVSGKTRPLTVSVDNHECEIEFIVFDHEDYYVLLGLDWFYKTKCGIFPSEARLTFPSEKWVSDYESGLTPENDTIDIFLSEVSTDSVDIEADYFWEKSEIKMKPTCKLEASNL